MMTPDGNPEILMDGISRVVTLILCTIIYASFCTVDLFLHYQYLLDIIMDMFEKKWDIEKKHGTQNPNNWFRVCFIPLHVIKSD
jgi:hypothetical protein